MEINLNNNGFGNIGMDRGMPETTAIDVGRETTDASPASRRTSLNVSRLSSNIQSKGLASAEPVADVPDEVLSRDDALGKLMATAFNLPPPPMPAFG